MSTTRPYRPAALFLLLLAAPILAEEAGPTTPSLADVIEGVKMRSQMVSRLHVEMTREIYNVPSYDQRDDPSAGDMLLADAFSIYRKDNKLRFTREDTFNARGARLKLGHSAWDGERGRGYATFRDPPELIPGMGGGIYNTKGHAYGAGNFLHVIEEQVLDTRMTLLQDIDASTWRVIGTETVNGYRAVLIEGPWKPGHGMVTYQVWVAPEYDFAPVKMRVTRKLPEDGPDAVVESTDVVLEQIDGVWLAVRLKVVNHNPRLGSQWQVFSFAVSKAQVGLDIPDDVFVLRFPAGLQVIDGTTQIVYKAAADGTLEPLYYAGTQPYAGFDMDTKTPASLDKTSSQSAQPTISAKEELQDPGSAAHLPVQEDGRIQSTGWTFRRYAAIAVAALAAVAMILACMAVARRRQRA